MFAGFAPVPRGCIYMRVLVRSRALSALALCCALSACGGGGTSNGGGTSGGSNATPTPTPDTSQADKENDAARLAKQATFGATPAVVSRIVTLGVNGWLDEQFAATGSTYADLAANVWSSISCAASDTICQNTRNTRMPVAMRLYSDALTQPDQLRQRVALALSQIVVSSSLGLNGSVGPAVLNQIFLENAFGNYRDILKKATMTCYMGMFLNMAGSAPFALNENYARELFQLFSMGENKLNMDGTAALDSSGNVIPNYTPTDIRNIARALTGWDCAQVDGGAGNTLLNDYSKPMRSLAMYSRYDNGSKTFLGTTTGGDQNANIDAVIDAAMNGASTPPYISKQLIQHLVTSNPSPAYVARVAAVFVNNGSNVRGDLKAVVKAILTDTEARGASHVSDRDGKVKEPVLLMTGIARATNMTSDGYVFTQRDAKLGQAVFNSPSVFNFYPPDYPLAKSATLVSPTSKLIGTGSVVLRHNLVYDWTVGAATTPTEFAAATTQMKDATGSAQDWASWEAFGSDLDGMIDRVDLLLTARSLSATQKAALKSAATAITDSNAALQARKRAQTLLYIVGTSPFFQVDR